MSVVTATMHHPPLPPTQHQPASHGLHPPPVQFKGGGPRRGSIARVDVVGERFGGSTPRVYTPIKEVGDGSFGTVWLADWKSPPLRTTDGHEVGMSDMQKNGGTRPDWAGKRLVAVKRMKKAFQGGWAECEKLKELKSLITIPSHPNLIPLYDAFLHPTSRELYFVFECMEGNLYQLTKSRRGRPLAAGLVASCFRQMVAGLAHMHQHGYFHRDMKPENLLITTTGLTDYPSPTGHGVERDVTIVAKLADFGLAREIKSKPPYTEYVSTRWYRAPEVLLRSRDYSAPVDLWALGTILAEIVNLKPLFPGQSEVDQVFRICEVLGDPGGAYGVDERGRKRGGGDWDKGVKMAKAVGFQFPKINPLPLATLFDSSAPTSLIDLVADLLRYDPKTRLTCTGCFESPYFRDFCARVDPSHPNYPPAVRHSHHHHHHPIPPPISTRAPLPPEANAMQGQSPRHLPPSHAFSPHPTKPTFADGADPAGRSLPPPHSPYAATAPYSQQQHHPSYAPGLQKVPSTESFHSGRSFHSGASVTTFSTPALTNGSSTDAPPMPAYLALGDLASYGARPRPPSPDQSSIYSVGGDRASSIFGPRPHAHDRTASLYSTSTPDSGHRNSVAPTTSDYDGSIYEGNSVGGARSFVSFNFRDSFASGMSGAAPRTIYDDDLSYDSHMADASSSPPLPPPHLEEPPPAAVAPAKPSKASKWLGGVFGGGGSDAGKADGYAQSSKSIAGGSLSLKRTVSGTQPNKPETIPENAVLDPKKAKREAERIAKAAEKARREELQQQQRERARAVLNKQKSMSHSPGTLSDTLSPYMTMPLPINLNMLPTPGDKHHPFNSDKASVYSRAPSHAAHRPDKGKAAASERHHSHSQQQQQQPQPAQQQQPGGQHPYGQYAPQHPHAIPPVHDLDDSRLRDLAFSQHRSKARRRDDDDDHSMSSFDARSVSRLSFASFATEHSDPGPARPPRHAGHPYSIHRTASHSSIRTAGSSPHLGGHGHAHGYAELTRSNVSVDSQLVQHMQQATVGSPVPTPAGVRLPEFGGSSGGGGAGVQLPSIQSLHAGMDFDSRLRPLGQGPGPGPSSPHAINPIFQVPDPRQASTTTLPPFSHIANSADFSPHSPGPHSASSPQSNPSSSSPPPGGYPSSPDPPHLQPPSQQYYARPSS